MAGRPRLGGIDAGLCGIDRILLSVQEVRAHGYDTTVPPIV